MNRLAIKHALIEHSRLVTIELILQMIREARHG